MTQELSTLLRYITLAFDNAVENTQQELMQGYRSRYTPVLNAVDRMHHCTVKELANYLQLTQPAITQTVKLMVTAELLIMTKDKEDSRSRRLCLSQKGKDLVPLIANKTKRITEAVESLEDDIGFSLVDALTLTLEAITEKTFDERITAAEQHSDQGE